jgi:hypothetical protein
MKGFASRDASAVAKFTREHAPLNDLRDVALEELRNELAHARLERDAARADRDRWVSRMKLLEGKLDAMRAVLR